MARLIDWFIVWFIHWLIDWLGFCFWQDMQHLLPRWNLARESAQKSNLFTRMTCWAVCHHWPPRRPTRAPTGTAAMSRRTRAGRKYSRSCRSSTTNALAWKVGKFSFSLDRFTFTVFLFLTVFFHFLNFFSHLKYFVKIRSVFLSLCSSVNENPEDERAGRCLSQQRRVTAIRTGSRVTATQGGASAIDITEKGRDKTGAHRPGPRAVEDYLAEVYPAGIPTATEAPRGNCR